MDLNQPTEKPALRSPAISGDALSHYYTAWSENSLLDYIGKSDLVKDALTNLRQVVPDGFLREVLPSADKRPVLAAAVVLELADFKPSSNSIRAEDLIAASPILSTLSTRYKPIMMSDLIYLVERSSGHGLSYQTIKNISDSLGGMNSTLRNLCIANLYNEGLFANSTLKADIALTQYTWRGLHSQISTYAAPDLPAGSADSPYLRFTVAISRGTSLPLTYFDYGHPENQEKYGKRSTGEGAGIIVGSPLHMSPIEPNETKELIFAFKQVAASQKSNPSEPEAIRRIDVHNKMIRQLVDFVKTSEGLQFPAVISEVNDLSEKQLQSVLLWSNLVEKMLENSTDRVNSQEMRMGRGLIFTMFAGKHARVESSQPSTRTVSAAADALRSLGMTIDIPSTSSREKGESTISEGVTLSAHNVDIVLRRDPNFENEAPALRALGSKVPVHICLGGNKNHPTQTLGEIKAFMDYFGCGTYSLDQLRSNTFEEPPTITFIGRTDQKRADKALIAFILEHLPHWNVRVLVPTEKDVPKLDLPDGARYMVKVESELNNDDVVLRETQGSTFIYTSNSEATSNVEEKGKGDGKKAALFHIPVEVLSKNGCHLMHPLPASAELDERIFHHKHSLIRQQMENKIYVIASLTAHQLIAAQEREASRSFDT